MKIKLLNEIASICCVPYQTVDDVIFALVNERILECYPSPDTETFEDLSFSKSWHWGRHLEKLEEATKSTPIDATYIMKHRDGLLWKIGRTVDIPKRAKAISGHDRGSFTPVFWVYEPVEESYSRVRSSRTWRIARAGHQMMPHLETEMIQACKAYLIPGERELLRCPPDISTADFESLLIEKLSSLKQERLPQLLKRMDNIWVRYALLAVKWEKQQEARRATKAAKEKARRASEKINFGLGHFNANGWAPATKTFWKHWHSPEMKTYIKREGFTPRPFGYEVGANTEWVVFRSEKCIPTHRTTKPSDTQDIGEVIDEVLLILKFRAECHNEED